MCLRECRSVEVAAVAWSCRRRSRMKLLQRHSHVDRVKESTCLRVHLHNGAARNRFTHSKRCRGEVVRVSCILRGNGINAWRSHRSVETSRADAHAYLSVTNT